MGKTRGHGSRRGAYKSRSKREEGDDSSEEEYEQPRGLGGQSATAGMLPPSDSEDEEESGDGGEAKEAKAKGGAEGGEAAAAAKEKKPKKAKGGQSRNAGKLPPSGSEDEDEDEESEEESDDESSDEAPEPAYLSQPAAPRRKKGDDEPDPEQIRKDMERLEMIKQRREQDRLKRIKDEGWDRFAPISETNKPPGHVPTDHPSQKE